MRKYKNNYKKGQNGAKYVDKKPKKNPSRLPFYLKPIPILLLVVMMMLSYPDYTIEKFTYMVLVCFAVYIVILILWKVNYRRMLAGASIERIDKMSGEEFEDYLALLYRKHGFEVKTTPKTCDFGADLIVTDKKKGTKVCVQAKRYRNLVGEAAVQQTLSGWQYYDCDKAMIITNSHYTDAAKALAKKVGIIMIDRYSLGTEKMYLF